MKSLTFESINNLNDNEFCLLFNFIGYEKLLHIPVDYRKDDKSKKHPFGKGSKEWRNINSENPGFDFVLTFIRNKLRDEKVEKEVIILSLFKSKLFKSIDSSFTNLDEIEETVLLEKINVKKSPFKECLLKLFGFDFNQEVIDDFIENFESQRLDEKERKPFDFFKVKSTKKSSTEKVNDEKVEIVDEELASSKKEEESFEEEEYVESKSSDKKENSKSFSDFEKEIKKLNGEISTLNAKLEKQTKTVTDQKNKIKEAQSKYTKLVDKLNKCVITSNKNRKKEISEYSKDDLMLILEKIKQNLLDEKIDEAMENMIRCYILSSIIKGE